MPAIDLEPTLVLRPIPPADSPRVAASFDPHAGVYQLHVPRPLHAAPFAMTPAVTRWFLDRLLQVQHRGPRRHLGWRGGRALEIATVHELGSPMIRLRQVGLPRAGTGWQQELRFPETWLLGLLIALSHVHQRCSEAGTERLPQRRGSALPSAH